MTDLYRGVIMQCAMWIWEVRGGEVVTRNTLMLVTHFVLNVFYSVPSVQ